MRSLNQTLSHRSPEVINSNQGSQFTNKDYLKLLKSCGVQVSMDGKGRALDNVRTERFFRSLKYEDVYIKAYEDLRVLRFGVGAYIADYNAVRPHQALGGLTPEQVYARHKDKNAA